MTVIVERRIYHIEDTVANIEETQLCFEPIDDPDLDFHMWCGKDDLGNVTKWLAKDKNARVNDFGILGVVTGNVDMDSHSITKIHTLSGPATVTPLTVSSVISLKLSGGTLTLSDGGRGTIWENPMLLSSGATSWTNVLADWEGVELPLLDMLHLMKADEDRALFHDGTRLVTGDIDFDSHSLENVVNITSNDADMIGINSTHIDGEYAICGHAAVQVTGEDDPITAGLDVSDTGSVIACTDSTNPLATISNEISAGLTKCALTRTDAGAVSAQVNVGADGVSFSDAAQLASTWNTDLKVSRSGENGVADYDSLKVNAVTELSMVEMFNLLFGRGGIQADGGDLIKGPVNLVSGSNIVFTQLDDEEGFRADVAIGNVRLYPSSASTNPGTATGDVADLATWNENAIYHVQGAEGTPGMSTIFVVPLVVNFDLVQMRARYVAGGIGHVDVDLYNLVTEEWDTIGFFTAADSYEVKSWPVTDGASYISLDGNVQIRVQNPQSGQTTDELSVDWMCVVRSAAGAQDITLQTAYNGGRSIIASSGPVLITVPEGSTNGAQTISTGSPTATAATQTINNESPSAPTILLAGAAGDKGEIDPTEYYGHRIWTEENALSVGRSYEVEDEGETYTGETRVFFRHYEQQTPTHRNDAILEARNGSSLAARASVMATVEYTPGDDASAQSSLTLQSSGDIEIGAEGYIDFPEGDLRNIDCLTYGADAVTGTHPSTGAYALNFETGAPIQELTLADNCTSLVITKPVGKCCVSFDIFAGGADRTVTGIKDSVTNAAFVKWKGGDGDPDAGAITIPSGASANITIIYTCTSTLRASGTFILDL